MAVNNGVSRKRPISEDQDENETGNAKLVAFIMACLMLWCYCSDSAIVIYGLLESLIIAHFARAEYAGQIYNYDGTLLHGNNALGTQFDHLLIREI
jgi:hypothetical protein